MPMREPPSYAAPRVKAPAPRPGLASVPTAGAVPAPAPGPAAVLALQRTIGNHAVAALLQRAPDTGRPLPVPAPQRSPAAIVQRVKTVELPEQNYGAGFSAEAADYRRQHRIASHLNVATFLFVPRPPLGSLMAGDGGRSVTRSSTGVGVEGSNASHSEAVIIDELDLFRQDHSWFPQTEVIKWIYTDRPPCFHARPGGGSPSGCQVQIQALENKQKLLKWDGVAHDRFATRDELEITVFWSVASGSDAAPEIEMLDELGPHMGDAAAWLGDQLEALREPFARERALRHLAKRWERFRSAGVVPDEYPRMLEAAAREAVEMAQMRREELQSVTGDIESRLEEDYYDGPQEEYDLTEIDGARANAWEIADEHLTHWMDFDGDPDEYYDVLDEDGDELMNDLDD